MFQPYQTQVSPACLCHCRCRMYPASKSTVRPSCGRKNAMRAYGPRLFCASELCPVCASGPRPVCATRNMKSAVPMIQSQRCFMIFPFESGELLICGPLSHYLKLLAASAQARNFFDLYAVIVIDGPGAHVRVSVVNRGVDRCAACDVARPSSLCAPDHPFADVFSDLGHRDKRATIVGHANGVPGLKPPRRRILRMDADGWRACSLQLRRDVRKDGIDEVIPVSALTESTGNHSIIETLVGEFARQPFGQP